MPPPPRQNLLEPPAPPRNLPEAPIKIKGAVVEAGVDARKSDAGAAQEERALVAAVAAVAAEGELLHFMQLASERAGERDQLAYSLRYASDLKLLEYVAFSYYCIRSGLMPERATRWPTRSGMRPDRALKDLKGA
jgi:hypothetical protein